MHCSSPFPLYSYVNPLLHLVLKNNIITSLKVRQRLLVGVMNYLFTICSAALASLTALLACPSACWQGKRISYILLSSSSVSSATSFFSTTPSLKFSLHPSLHLFYLHLQILFILITQFSVPTSLRPLVLYVLSPNFSQYNCHFAGSLPLFSFFHGCLVFI